MKMLFALVLPFLLSPSLTPKTSFQGKFFDESQMLDLTPSTKEEIDLYYKDVDTSLKGEDFIASLYDTISIDNSFLSYTQVNDWYKITDRNDALSQKIDPATYQFKDDKNENYFLVQLYSSHNDDPTKAYNTNVNGNGWAKDETLTSIDWESKRKNNGNIQIDKEHVWAKSHGFAPGDGDPSKGAGTDLHHLIAADHNTNSAGHNNLDYGEVKDKENSKVLYSYNADGTKDISGYRGENEEGIEVFEPMDEWKGDIARALLYMGVRYSSDENNSKEEPHLVLTDDFSLQDDNDIFFGVQHGLSTFLEWNELDPVDDYERQRNDRIDKNVQNNRNPFVDHPEWARKAYAPDTLLPFDFSSLKDKYEAYVGVDFGLDINFEEKVTVQATSSDPEIVEVLADKKTIHPLKAGTATVTYVVQYEEEEQTFTTNIEVAELPKLSGLPENNDSYLFTIEAGKKEKLNLSLVGGRGETLRYRSTDEEIAGCEEDGTIVAKKEGECQIEISILNNGVEVVLASLSLSIKPRSTLTYILIIAGCVLLLILFFLVIFFLGRKKKKKVKAKQLTKRRK